MEKLQHLISYFDSSNNQETTVFLQMNYSSITLVLTNSESLQIRLDEFISEYGAFMIDPSLLNEPSLKNLTKK